MLETNRQTDSAFLDIAANMLAILLIITLFSLVTVQHHTYSSTNPDAVTDPTLHFVEPQREFFPPFSSFYFVIADRVVIWDQTAVIDALLKDQAAFSGQTPQGRYRWMPEPLIARDIDTFRLNFFIDEQAILTDTQPFSQTVEHELLNKLIEAYARYRVAPVFIVYPSGMETFARLYLSLQNSKIRFRWFARKQGAPLYIGRHPAQFTHYGIYW